MLARPALGHLIQRSAAHPIRSASPQLYRSSQENRWPGPRGRCSLHLDHISHLCLEAIGVKADGDPTTIACECEIVLRWKNSADGIIWLARCISARSAGARA